MIKALSGHPDSVLDYIDRENMRKVLYEYKKSLLNYPDGPTSPRALVIPEEWTRHPNGDPFVIHDRIVDDERIVVMSSPFMLEVVHYYILNGHDKHSSSEACQFRGDGTFDMKFPSDDRENKWAQIYTIHVHENGVFVPAVTIASSRRTARVYANALIAIKEYILNTTGVTWEPEVILTDFEAAVGSALQLVFQHDYLHKGCYFHYSQALMSHIKELGLMKEYNKNIVFNEYIRKLKVLAMVPFYSLDGCLEHLLDFR